MDKPISHDTPSLRILLADDNEPFRRRMHKFMQETPDFGLLGEAASGEEAVRLAAELQPDVVVTDVLMPDLNGIEVTRRIKGEFPLIEVIALSMHDDEGFRRAMLDAGATTYLLKDNVLHELPKVLHSIAAARLIPSPLDAAND